MRLIETYVLVAVEATASWYVPPGSVWIAKPFAVHAARAGSQETPSGACMLSVTLPPPHAPERATAYSPPNKAKLGWVEANGPPA